MSTNLMKKDILHIKFVFDKKQVFESLYRFDLNETVTVKDERSLCEWRAELSKNERNQQKINLEISLLNNSHFKNIRVGYSSVYILDTGGNKVELTTLQYNFYENIWFCSNFWSKNKLHVTEDGWTSRNFSFNFEIEVYTPSVKTEKESSSKISENIERMFYDGKFTDVVLSLNGVDFKAHKCILSERSPVFASLFAQKDMKDQEKLVIKDMKPGVMRQLLIFIYAGIIVNHDSQISDLFKAAEKYGIDDFKTVYKESLSKEVRKEDFMSYVIISDLLNDKDMKAKCLDYAHKNVKDVIEMMKSRKWCEIVESNMDLAEEIVLAMKK